MITFGRLLKEQRNKAGLTQSELVELSNNVCSAVSISHIENSCKPGRKPIRPSLEIVDGLARALGIPKEVARTAANYASSFENSESDASPSGVFSNIFASYERLEAPYREMAIALCGATLNTLYDIQMGLAGHEDLQRRAAAPSALGKSVPLIYPTMESNVGSPEFVGKDNED